MQKNCLINDGHVPFSHFGWTKLNQAQLYLQISFNKRAVIFEENRVKSHLCLPFSFVCPSICPKDEWRMTHNPVVHAVSKLDTNWEQMMHNILHMLHHKCMTTKMHAFTLGEQKETDNTTLEGYIYVHRNQNIQSGFSECPVEVHENGIVHMMCCYCYQILIPSATAIKQ